MLTTASLRAALLTLALLPACAPPAALAPAAVEILPALPAPSASPRVEVPLPPSDGKGAGDDVAWSGSEPDALARARREHRPMILDFTAEWCGACKELDRNTYSDPGVKAALTRFVRVKVDATDDEDAAVDAIKSRYRVVGLPTIVVLDSIGKEQARFTQFVSPDQLVPILSRIK
jgi:thiol:disulfide interchange protein DsbD